MVVFEECRWSTGACQPTGPMRCLALLIQGGGSIKMCDPQVALPDARGC